MQVTFVLCACTLPDVEVHPHQHDAGQRRDADRRADAAIAPEEKEHDDEQAGPAAGSGGSRHTSDEADGGEPTAGSGGSSGKPASAAPNTEKDTDTDAGTEPPANDVLAQWPIPERLHDSPNQPSYTVADNTVTDNVTGLLWQRNLPEMYPNCQETDASDNMIASEACTWDKAKAYCQSPQLAAALGSEGWRLPSKIELESLIDETRVGPSIDTDAFPNTPERDFWTSTPNVGPEHGAWMVDFQLGFASHNYGKGARVRCVRTFRPPSALAEYQYERATETVRDRKTGLTWQRDVDPQQRSWDAANFYCRYLALTGNGWRLPGIKELLSIVDPTRWNPALDLNAFPEGGSDEFWSASPYVGNGNYWYLDGTLGETETSPPGVMMRVRCVR